MFSQNVVMTPAGREALYTRIRAGDMSARNELALNYRPFVRGYVFQVQRLYKLGPEHLDDLFSECMAGLMQAAVSFDPDRGTVLPTHARYYLKNAVDEYLVRVVNGTTMPSGVLKKKYKFARIRKKIEATGQTVTAELMQELTGFSLPLCRSFMEGKIQFDPALSLATPINESSGGRDETWQDRLEATDGPVETGIMETQLKALIHEVVALLPDRSRLIIERRRLTDTPDTLEVLGQELGITRERVRQIEAKAFEKIRQLLQKRRIRSFADVADP